MSTFIYKRKNGAWVCGAIDAVKRIQQYVLELPDGTHVRVKAVGGTVVIPSTLATDVVKKEDGTKYASQAALIAATTDFFYVAPVVPLVKSVFIPLITQVGTATPTVAILENTIGTVVPARSAAGTYTLTKIGAFLAGKTLPVNKIINDITGNKITIERTSDDVMTIKTYAVANTAILADDVLAGHCIKIETYK